MELIDELKLDCLLKTSVFELFANELDTLIVIVVRLISVSGHDIGFKNINFNSDIQILDSKYFKKSNIQKLKARSLLKKVVPNINIIFVEPFPKPCR